MVARCKPREQIAPGPFFFSNRPISHNFLLEFFVPSNFASRCVTSRAPSRTIYERLDPSRPPFPGCSRDLVVTSLRNGTVKLAMVQRSVANNRSRLSFRWKCCIGRVVRSNIVGKSGSRCQNRISFFFSLSFSLWKLILNSIVRVSVRRIMLSDKKN